MKIVLLAGGKGERLRPLTNSLPKPMVPIGKKPLIEYSIDLFRKYGYSDFIFTLCYMPFAIKKKYGDGKKMGITLSYFEEDEENPLGTAGALAYLKKDIKKTFIVCAGDILRSINIKKLVDYHKKKKAIATIVVYDNKRPNPKSYAIFDKNGRIKDFIERPKELPKGIIWSNASLYVLEPEILELIPKNKPSDFGKEIFPELLKNGERVFAYQESGYFLDVGDKEKIEIAEKDIKKGSISL